MVGSQFVAANRGVSKVVGIILLVAIVLLLAVTAGTMALSFSDEEPDPSSLTAVEINENRFNVEIRARSSLERTDELKIQVNGETRRVWNDFSAGSTTSVQCVRPGDTVSIVSPGDDQSHVISEHTVREKTDCRFEVSTGSGTTTTQPVSPIGWQESSEEYDEFYSYDHAHAHMDPESDVISPDTSYMFFYEYNDQVALVIVHDIPEKHGPGIDGSQDHSGSDVPSVDDEDYTYDFPSDTGGGAVDMTFEGLPDSGSWVLKDDPADWNYANIDDGEQCDAVDHRVCWSWVSRNTDGGIYAGGFDDPDAVDIKVTANWNDPNVPHNTIGDGHINPATGGGEITDWKFLYATDDGIESIDLDKDGEVHIDGLSR